jgi:hypothetical protein
LSELSRRIEHQEEFAEEIHGTSGERQVNVRCLAPSEGRCLAPDFLTEPIRRSQAPAAMRLEPGTVNPTPLFSKISLKLSKISLTLSKIDLKLSKNDPKLSKNSLKLSKISLKLSKISLKLSKIDLKLSKISLKLSKISLKLSKISLKLSKKHQTFLKFCLA